MQLAARPYATLVAICVLVAGPDAETNCAFEEARLRGEAKARTASAEDRCTPEGNTALRLKTDETETPWSACELESFPQDVATGGAVVKF